MVALEGLQFDNTVLRVADVDAGPPHEPRPVRNAIYAYVNPTPLRKPKLVAVSAEALDLLGLDATEANRVEFTEVMAGNRLLPGMTPAAHCYAGYQFGYFSGQLGDGAAVYLGEVVHPISGLRNELQLKGSGLTPFSRAADGRKVMRSSMREFLASEAMHALGIPSTRAGSLVVSGVDTVVRDVHYSGNPQEESCAVISRIAPSFIRFGSFEVCKATDPVTSRAGPSAGQAGTLLLPLLGYTIKQHYPEVWSMYSSSSDDISMKHMGDAQVLDMVEAWFTEVCRRTAHLVACWQSVGFVHGVLNTDNMSILGLTLDYGPYGFMDRFDSKHVSNGSDDGARYTYEAQPPICYWNLQRLAEALEKTPLPSGAAAAAAAAAAGSGLSDGSGVGSVLPAGRARKALAQFDAELQHMYRALFRRKLGLLGSAAAAAAAAHGSSSSSSAAKAVAAASDRPVLVLSSTASPAVAAAAAAVTAAAADPAADLEDDQLIKDLLDLMDSTGADFTNTFRKLAGVSLPARRTDNAAAAAGSDDAGSGDHDDRDGDGIGDLLDQIISDLASPAELAAGSKPTMPVENLKMLLMLAGRDAALLHTLGLTPAALQQQLAAHTAAARWSSMTAADKRVQDQQQWRSWISRYRDRLRQETDAGVTNDLRRAVMSATNPRVVLRNWIAQAAISSAENGQINKVKQILDILKDPFSDADHLELELPAPVAAAAAGAGKEAAAEAAGSTGGRSAAAAADGGGGACPLVKVQFDGKPPAWAAELCVTCSS